MKRPRFCVLLENGNHGPLFMTSGEDEKDETPALFHTAEAARDAARGAPWEHAWVWWIVNLEDGGRTRYGTDLP